ncbi:Alkyl hydroperoxide reductase subunit C-like protein [Candidatus Rhodobacter oscarellae]|uniref:Alkyl hydroperoxide reductase subunit C-like protein n=1 Tax=Candidatus Rhodobacter oscarellae TaxID=1675527 RepID=A0A0J9H1U1_9RHOB|nr:peroxiredoxin [Candidatus Rhodobacter lobularis]KMW59688.1 Alkyl hydroperoxide reductase subunit C-like protein [Candidatus Rhodobacter lobularis]
MPLALNSTAPDFLGNTTFGPLWLHNWMGDAWCVLFSHPKDFTPVCTTELGAVAKMQPEFERRGVKLIGLSIDGVEDHTRWSSDIEHFSGTALTYPLISDPELKIAKMYGMLPEDAGNSAAERSAMDNATARTVFVIGPDKKIKASVSYPMNTGRDFDEILRVVDSLQLTARHQLATPANWRPGEDVVITPAVTNEMAQERFPQGWSSPLPYLRLVGAPA